MEEVKEDVANDFANKIFDIFSFIPKSDNFRDIIKRLFLQYHDKILIKHMDKTFEYLDDNMKYDCELCKDTGITTYKIDRGSHFGGGEIYDIQEKFCSCYKGTKKSKTGYKLKMI